MWCFAAGRMWLSVPPMLHCAVRVRLSAPPLLRCTVRMRLSVPPSLRCAVRMWLCVPPFLRCAVRPSLRLHTSQTTQNTHIGDAAAAMDEEPPFNLALNVYRGPASIPHTPAEVFGAFFLATNVRLRPWQ
jgi:hypothetical protein